MAQAGLHALLGFQVARIISPKKYLLPAIIIGALIPDLDLIIVAFASLIIPLDEAAYLYHRTFTHNFFIIILLYLTCAILAEIKSTPHYKVMGKGLSLGMLSHLILDTLFWFSPIYLLWPLPVKPFNFWNFVQFPEFGYHILMTMEFFFFQIYAAFLIHTHLKFPDNKSQIISQLNLWRRTETALFFLFAALLYLHISGFKILFGAAYIPSLIFAIWATWQSRHSLEQISQNTITN
ncbi:MAG: metal-dependent hydrolase [Candidatus Marinimicrobia bacterium]|jgi:membrane-bound metal-dependent hydrolase YbcI (DUF457 family)|nr:metal-dependent hydrolase [Candidatus Neomarinimicrobiota bacterium]MDP6853241.1 metal-dependent hydrolase [Candidatus Neomarinimicrobiota bacterium]